MDPLPLVSSSVVVEPAPSSSLRFSVVQPSPEATAASIIFMIVFVIEQAICARVARRLRDAARPWVDDRRGMRSGLG
jgi:hypothetical protein